MALPAYPTDDAAQISGTSSDDMINGGHRTRFFPLLNAVLALSGYVKGVGEFLVGLAEQVATDAASAAAGSGTEAAIANIRAGTSAHYLSIRRAYAAAAPVALTDAASVAIDFATAINFGLTIGGNRTLAAPTNLVPGKSGLIIVTQDATGGRSLGKVSIWKVLGGALVLDPVPGGKTVFSYYIESETSILVTGSEGFA